MLTPRSSCPGGEPTPLRGAANLRLLQINNLTQTLNLLCVGDSPGPHLAQLPWAHLQAPWVILGKRRRYAEFGNMRSMRHFHRVGEAALESLTLHILLASERGNKLIDRAEMATAKMRVRHRFDGFQLLGWVCLQIHFRCLHLCVSEP